MQVMSSFATSPADVTVVGIADFVVCGDQGHVLVTFALGSCVAVCLHDPIRQIAGMIHYMLPSAKISPDKARSNPAMFCDTGVPALVRSLCGMGSTRADLVVKVVGGACVLGTRTPHDIGQRNLRALRRVLAKERMQVAVADIGGRCSRTVWQSVKTGRVKVTSSGQEYFI